MIDLKIRSLLFYPLNYGGLSNVEIIIEVEIAQRSNTTLIFCPSMTLAGGLKFVTFSVDRSTNMNVGEINGLSGIKSRIK